MKFLVPNYSCPQITILSVLCPQLNLLTPPEQNPWVRHCHFYVMALTFKTLLLPIRSIPHFIHNFVI